MQNNFYSFWLQRARSSFRENFIFENNVIRHVAMLHVLARSALGAIGARVLIKAKTVYI